MPEVDRRRFLTLTGGGAALGLLPPCIARAASIPANRDTGTLEDVEHVVCSCRRTAPSTTTSARCAASVGSASRSRPGSPTGKPVWRPPTSGSGTCLPFHYDTPATSAQRYWGLPHGWPDGQHGLERRAVRRVGAGQGHRALALPGAPTCPYQFALADAFTVCDAYHCSLLGRTDTNRYYRWSVWTGRRHGQGGGPALDNTNEGPPRLQLDDLPRAAAKRPACAGRSTRTKAPASTPRAAGARTLRPVHRQLRRQLAALLPTPIATPSPATRSTRSARPRHQAPPQHGQDYFELLPQRRCGWPPTPRSRT